MLEAEDVLEEDAVGLRVPAVEGHVHAAEHAPILGSPHRGGQSSASVRGTRSCRARQDARTERSLHVPDLVAPDGRPVGTVGLWPGAEEVALGYWVVASARGGGAAATGLAAVADRALRGLGLPRLVCTSSRGTPPPCASPSAWVSGAKGCGRGGCGSGASAGTCSCSRSRTATGARRHAPGARHPALRGRPGMTGRPGCTRVISTSR
ncbi:GNAT family N-acetyltransferase [Streptomyces sp. WAC04657]|uniref:GNAT family N-acetyltransferase n=1 Tax=unclassified Streptomyces TaxID=2593676 RepID=UPI003B63EBA2